MKLQARSYKLEATLGLSVVEILVVIGIMVVLVGVVVIPFASFREQAILDGATEETLALLHEARERTVSSDGASRYGVYFESDKVTLFKGATFPGAGDPDNKEILLHNRLVLTKSASLDDGVIFERLTGKIGAAGTTTVSLISDSTKYRTIEISQAGLASLVVGSN